MITWIKKKRAEWKESAEEQRRFDAALQVIVLEMRDIYLGEFRKYYEPKIKELLGRNYESKKTD